MKPKEAEKLAAKALPCPFCGERLVVSNDHHGCWVGHKQEPGPCFFSVAQLIDETDLIGWNKRVGICNCDDSGWPATARIGTICDDCGGVVIDGDAPNQAGRT